MKAFIAQSPDTPACLVDIAAPPPPAPGEVLVKVVRCGLNFADLLLAQGQYQDKRPFPVTLGMEVSGRVEACGFGVETVAPGDRVAVFTGHGGLAERVSVAASRCLRLPDRVDFDTAATFQIAYGSSHMALDYKANLRSGQRLLVLGAAGGVGLTAIEIGKRMGAHVTAVARGADKLAIAKAAGADETVDGASEDLRAVLKALPKFDVVYDPVGGETFRAALSACAPQAIYLLIGFAGGLPEIPANHLLVKNITLIGFWWGGYLTFNPEPLSNSLKSLLAWLSDGTLHPHSSHHLPFEQTANGLELIRTRQATGKVVINVDQSVL